MPGLNSIDRRALLAYHPGVPPKKREAGRTKPELSKKIEEEVMKLLKVGFIEVSQYPEWVANIVSDSWKMFFDGAVNLSGSGTGAIMISLDGQHHLVAAKLIFPCTNNVAEYEACIIGLQAAIKMGVAKFRVFGDSALIILQTVGEWKTKDAKLLPYHEYLEDLVREFEEISFEYLPRSHNQFTDALPTLSSMLQVTDGLEVEHLKIEVLPKLAYCMIVTEELDGKPWYYNIMNYIKKQEFPKGSTPTDRKYITKMASKFFVSGENLYKRSYDSILLWCVDAAEAIQIM
ncbi:uncharacterized protein LOC120294374 [Eucalyptus grandis]|uniref:uncharacterized protein LOC120294374 n=1 Tax=Eucalyptus grandis TaxID=71139 RepID=UPI00192EEC21|nr:uncharacterized protein LOC120294374 [Eucalyptus grandis]